MTIDPSHPAPTGRNRLGTGPGQVVRRRLRLAGDDDPIIPLVNARIMHRLIPRSQLHIYQAATLSWASGSPSSPRVSGTKP
jgi:pimeloyl-ACP methyl ester carboxylesterase